MTAEADEPPAPWSAHASAMGAQDPVHSESITMRAHLESVVPANVVPEVERLLKVCCCVVDGVLSCARQSMGMCCAWHGWERCMLCCAVLCCAVLGRVWRCARHALLGRLYLLSHLPFLDILDGCATQ